MAGSLDWLVQLNDCLEQIPKNVTAFFESLIKSGQNLTQAYVDKVCIWISWWVNISVERLRQKTIKTLKEQYGNHIMVVKCANTLGKAIRHPLETLGKFFGIFAVPVKIVAEFIKTLIKELPRLANNLAKIVNSLPPSVPSNLNINFNAFKLKIGTISMKEILSDDAMPSPEEMFPEPERPFGKEFFNAAFTDVKGIASKDKLKQYLPKQGAVAEAINNKVNGNESSSSAISEEINKQVNE